MPMLNLTITSGDTYDEEVTVVDYPKSDGWALSYRLIPRVSGTAITFTAGASQYNAIDYRVQVSAATTALWTAGFYSWAALVTKAAERFLIDTGEVEVKADPGVSDAPSDTRTHARKTLDAIEAVIEGRATKDQMAYTIGTRSLQRTPLADLLKFRAAYRSEVLAEEAVAGKFIPRLLARL